MKKILLGGDGNHCALVDDGDYEYLSKYHWWTRRSKGTNYAVRQEWDNGKCTNIHMHRVVVGAKDGEIVDHINRNGLDNRGCNLRISTFTENLRNSDRKGKSGYYGVWLCRNKFRAMLYINSKAMNIGTYETAIEAAKAYNKKCIELGLMDKLNKIPHTPSEEVVYAD